MNEYLLIVYGYSGCDYSLGCGINVIDLKTNDYNQAYNKAMQIILDNLAGEEYVKYYEYDLGGEGFARWELIDTDWRNATKIQSAEIVLRTTLIDINAIKEKLTKEVIDGEKEKKERDEYEEYLRLQKKYE